MTDAGVECVLPLDVGALVLLTELHVGGVGLERSQSSEALLVEGSLLLGERGFLALIGGGLTVKLEAGVGVAHGRVIADQQILSIPNQ